MGRSIASTLALILLGITLVLLVASTVVRIHQGRDRVIDQARVQAEILRANITHAVRFEGLEASWLQPFLFSLGTEPGIHRLAVLDTDGTVRAHSEPGHIGELTALGFGPSPVHTLLGEDGVRLRLVAPIEPIGIQSGPLGTVLVELDLDRALRGNLVQQIGYLVVLMGVALAAVSAIYLLLHRSVIRPLELIEAGARHIQAGRWGERVAYDSHNELGALARTFNAMVERLEHTTVSRDYLTAIIRSMRDMLMVVDRQGLIRTVNPALLTALDYREEELLGQPLTRVLIDPAGSAWLWQDDPGQVLELAYRTRGGLEIPVAFFRSLMDDPQEGGRVLVCVARDVTADRQAAAALQRARDQALEASQAKSRFLANISHEIRTPLNGVLGMTERLLKGESDEQRRRLALVAHRSGQLLLELVNDLLDLSRIEAGRLDLEQVSFDPAQVVEESLEALAAQAASRGLELLHRLPNRLPVSLIGDPGRLRQILVNLLGNAIKFTERGEVVLTAELLEEGAEGMVIRLTVEDSGIGIPLDKQQAIFEPFTQVDGSTTRRYGGSGLGLSIVRQLATLMGGEAGVESRPGQGARFWVRLCLGRDPQAPPPSDWQELAGARVLIISSNAALCQHYRRLLGQDWGLEVAALKSCGWREEDLDPWDAVLLDLPAGQRPPPVLLRDDGPPVVALIPLGQPAAPDLQVLTRPVRRESLYRTLLGICRRLPEPVMPAREAPRPLVLIADDDPGARLVTRAALEQAGFRTLEAEDGLAAVEVARLLSPGVVLLDGRMPRLDGFQATRALRRLPALARVPIVILTALEGPDTLAQVYQAGASDFMLKPVDWQWLVERLDCLVRLQEPLARLRAEEDRAPPPAGSPPDLLVGLGPRGERLELCGRPDHLRDSGLTGELPPQLQRAWGELSARGGTVAFSYQGRDGRTWQGRLTAHRGGAVALVRSLEACPA